MFAICVAYKSRTPESVWLRETTWKEVRAALHEAIEARTGTVDALPYLAGARPCFTPQSNQLSTTVPVSKMPMPPVSGQRTANHHAQR